MWCRLTRKRLGPARIYKDGEEFKFSFITNEKAAAPKIYKFNGFTGILQKIFRLDDVEEYNSTWVVYVYLARPLKMFYPSVEVGLRIKG
jgi:hypothetical protein